MKIKITGELDGITVKEYLYKNGFSRGLITELKKSDDGICVNGDRVTVRRILAAGDELSLCVDDRQEDENENLVPTRMSLDIIYEDDNMIALNKPSGMATHPSIGHFDDTLANGLAYYFAERSVPFVFRSINRLDLDTSGVVLVAKNRLTAAKLGDSMRSGGIRKTYTAMLNGCLTPESGTISACIKRRADGIILREVCAPDAHGAKSALTEYATVYSGRNVSVVSAEPVTGRTHQLRVHFSYMGAPIIGDAFYGTAETEPTEFDRMIKRQALHASGLTVKLDGKEYRFNAPLPPDMDALRRRIEGDN